MGSWDVTPARVLDETGATVSESTIKIAGGIVETYINRTQAISGVLTARDLGWIQVAVQWQAAWLPEQPGFSGRMQVVKQAQDGAGFELDDSGGARDWAINLAPMAARSIKNLSWKGSRSLNMGTRRVTNRDLRAFLTDESDCLSDWQAI